jgi:hypothetical protein
LDTPGAFGLIDRIEVYDYLGSTQLESTSGFGQLISLLQDTHINNSEYGTHADLVSGGQMQTMVNDWERLGGSTPLGGATTTSNYVNQMFRPVQPTTGEIIDNGTWTDPINGTVTAVANARTIKRRYHIPLFSFLGLLSPKYAPLHNGYTIMITLQSAENALIACGNTVTVNSTTNVATVTPVLGTGVSFTVDNARMCCQILELGPIAESMLLSTTGGQPMIVTTKAYRNYLTTVPLGSANFRLDLNINVASLTNLLWIMRPTYNLGSLNFNSLSTRQRNFLESWYFQYGSSILPQTQGITAFKPLTNDPRTPDYGSECFIELLKARHLYNQADHKHCLTKHSFAYDNWARSKRLVDFRKNTNTYTGTQYFNTGDPNCYFEKGKFACGLDLELVSGRANEIICGMNTNGMNTAIFGTFNAKAAAVSALTSGDDFTNYTSQGIKVEEVRVDAWCEYDAFINISPGIATTVSF